MLARLTIAMCLATSAAAGQDAQPASPVVAVQSIDPADTEWSDLAPIGRAIGDARIVLLGEPTHSDGGAILAKSRLARYLIDELGFDVILWEGGMWDCHTMNNALLAGQDWRSLPALGLGAAWSRSGQVWPVFHRAWESYFDEPKIEMAGFDFLPTSDRAERHLPRDALALFAALDPNPIPVEQRRRFLTALERADEAIDSGDPEDQLQALDDLMWLGRALDEHAEALAAAHDPLELAMWRRIAGDIVESFDFRLQGDFGFGAGEDGAVSFNNPRDRRMGDHLLWLCTQRYPDRKIIVWAATFHLLADAGSIVTEPPGRFDHAVAAGQILRGGLGEPVYTIAVTTHSGSVGLRSGGPWTVPPPTPGGLEDRLARTGYRFPFVDLSSLGPDHPLRQPMASKIVGWREVCQENGLPADRTASADWGAQVDGVLMIDQTFPNSPRFGPPEGYEATLPLHQP